MPLQGVNRKHRHLCGSSAHWWEMFDTSFLKAKLICLCCFVSLRGKLGGGGVGSVKRKQENTAFFQESKHGGIIWTEGFLLCCFVSWFWLFSMRSQKANTTKLLRVLERFMWTFLQHRLLTCLYLLNMFWNRGTSRLLWRDSMSGWWSIWNLDRLQSSISRHWL